MQQGVSSAEIESLDRFLSLPVANESSSSSSSSLDMTREEGSDQQPSYLQYIYAKFGRGVSSSSSNSSSSSISSIIINSSSGGGSSLAVDSELAREDDSDDDRPIPPVTAAWGDSSSDISNNNTSTSSSNSTNTSESSGNSDVSSSSNNNSSNSSSSSSRSVLTDQMVLEWRMELAKNKEKSSANSTPNNDNNKNNSSNDESDDLIIEEIDISRSKYADILSFESKIDNFMELDLNNDESDENSYIPSFGGKFASPNARIKAREVVGNGENDDEEVGAYTTAVTAVTKAATAATSSTTTTTGVGGFSKGLSNVDGDWLLSNPELANTLELINELERLQLEALAEGLKGNRRRLQGNEEGEGGEEEEEIVINIDDDMDDDEGVISVTVDLFSEEDGFGMTADEPSSSSTNAQTSIATYSEFVVDNDSGGYKDRINELLRLGKASNGGGGASALQQSADASTSYSDEDNEVHEFVQD